MRKPPRHTRKHAYLMIRPGSVSSPLSWHPAVVVWTEFSRLFFDRRFAGLFRSYLLHLDERGRGRRFSAAVLVFLDRRHVPGARIIFARKAW